MVTLGYRNLMHGITLPLDQNKGEMDMPMLNHITSFFYSSRFSAMIPTEMSKVKINLDLQKHHIKCVTQHNHVVTAGL